MYLYLFVELRDINDIHFCIDSVMPTGSFAFARPTTKELKNLILSPCPRCSGGMGILWNIYRSPFRRTVPMAIFQL